MKTQWRPSGSSRDRTFSSRQQRPLMMGPKGLGMPRCLPKTTMLTCKRGRVRGRPSWLGVPYMWGLLLGTGSGRPIPRARPILLSTCGLPELALVQELVSKDRRNRLMIGREDYY